MRFTNHINLLQNQLQNGVLHALASAPGSPVAGQVYYNTNDKLAYVYDGNTWVAMAPNLPVAFESVVASGGVATINPAGAVVKNIRTVLTANTQLEFTASSLVSGATGMAIIVQGGDSGGYTLQKPSNYNGIIRDEDVLNGIGPGNDKFNIATAKDDITLISWFYDGITQNVYFTLGSVYKPWES